MVFEWKPCSCSYLLPHVYANKYGIHLIVELIGSKAIKQKQYKCVLTFIASARNWMQDLSVLSPLSCHLSHHTLSQPVLFILQIRHSQREMSELRTHNQMLNDRLESLSRSLSSGCSSSVHMSLLYEMEMSNSGSDSDRSLYVPRRWIHPTILIQPKRVYP